MCYCSGEKWNLSTVYQHKDKQRTEWHINKIKEAKHIQQVLDATDADNKTIRQMNSPSSTFITTNYQGI